MPDFDDLRVRQLDEALAAFQSVRQRPRPRSGWTRAIRKALGMTLKQVAARAGISQTAVRSVERNEARRKVRLDTLQNVADALDCEVVYALVPRTSLRAMIDARAELLASRMVSRVADTMELEDQGVEPGETMLQREALKRELLRDRPGNFWDD